MNEKKRVENRRQPQWRFLLKQYIILYIQLFELFDDILTMNQYGMCI